MCCGSYRDPGRAYYPVSPGIENKYTTSHGNVKKAYGLSMLRELYDMVVQSTYISDETKARISQRLAEADKCFIDGADEYLQLLDVASSAMHSLCNMTQECCY